MAGSGFNTHRPSKCQFGRCDWPYDTFHICVDTSKPAPKLAPKVEFDQIVVQTAPEEVKETRQKKNLERDKKIIELYLKGEIGTKAIAKELDCAYQTVRNVLKRNNVKLRPRGQTIYRPGNVRGAFN